MHEVAEWGLVKWLMEHVAIPLLSGLWAALAWWVSMIANKFKQIEAVQRADAAAIHTRISTMERDHAETYARRDDVKEGFARLDGKLDVLLRHALKDSQG